MPKLKHVIILLLASVPEVSYALDAKPINPTSGIASCFVSVVSFKAIKEKITLAG